MKKALKRLQRVLDLEASQGYKNRAVVGGIRQFATFWVDQARAEATSEQDKAFVEQAAELLIDYGRLPGTEARAKAIEQLQSKVQQRQAQEPASPPRQKPVHKPAQKPTKAAVSPPAKQKKPPAKATYQTPPPRNKKPSKWDRQPAPRQPVEPDPEGLAQSVTAVRGIGPKMAEQLTKLGASTIAEMLYIFPHRFDDYTLMKPIHKLAYGETVTVIGTIWETRARRSRSNQVIVQSVISDGTGKVQVTWFNQKWLVDKLKAGMQIVISGKVEQYLGRPVFNSPEWEPLELDPLKTRRIVPIYPLTKGLSSNRMRDIMRGVVNHWGARVADPLPIDLRQRQKLLLLSEALQQQHFPDSQQALHEARRRLVFDDLFLLQLGMQGFRQEWQSQSSVEIVVEAAEAETAVLDQFQQSLPYTLTAAQQRVIKEISDDIATSTPMNRLLQGDVGSGKTVVAAAALLLAAKAGYQSALMAPTEILAEQHFNGLQPLLEPLGVQVCLLTGSTAANEKERIYSELANGQIDLAIGTHALIQENVSFKNLALAIVDEQHRFGVDQRKALRDKGPSDGELNPHLLTMSATPIPRSLALSLYGDLDLSILDEMPPGRQEIKTYWIPTRERERVYSFIRKQVATGRQAYIIYPLVEESDKVDAKAAVAEHERLQKEVFPTLQVGLIHGRLSSSEKEAVMRAYHSGQINILVSTSVIEVGVDVPNSTVMLIDGANRFGLAQLHQFRGRVGRGEHQSYCILVADSETAVAEERLGALTQTNDGFALAEKDLEIRGPGQFFGRRQSGLPELRLASLLDMDMLQIAQNEAKAIAEKDPKLEQPEHQLLRQQVAHFWQNTR
ncbi:ATP-dependent DNA helicase RecG [hydrothermal vent metagenome]|uniref:ATP-dependent DNA helicase RecG n=1 Tax=hydrothermal vent metagenome TaxID=652676 RepID=A0A3B0VFH6_9ZZZZ